MERVILFDKMQYWDINDLTLKKLCILTFKIKFQGLSYEHLDVLKSLDSTGAFKLMASRNRSRMVLGFFSFFASLIKKSQQEVDYSRLLSSINFQVL
jgi:hypothetical protein